MGEYWEVMGKRRENDIYKEELSNYNLGSIDTTCRIYCVIQCEGAIIQSISITCIFQIFYYAIIESETFIVSQNYYISEIDI